MGFQSRGALVGLAALGAAAASCGSGAHGTAPSSGSVIVDSAELRWAREGSGPVVFVLGSSVYYPKAFSASLRGHFEMVFVDGRHFVPTYVPDSATLAEISLETFADDVEVVRAALGYGRIAVLGHSIHGQIALRYAEKYPAFASRVILVAPVPYSYDEFRAARAAVWDQLATPERKALLESRERDLDELLRVAPPSRSFAITYDRRAPRYWADPRYDATELLDGVETGPAFDQLFASVPDRAEVIARLQRIEAPMLLVLGKLDFAIPYTAWEEVIEGLENLKYELLEADSHNPQTESPERFDPLMIRWFGGLEGARSSPSRMRSFP